MEAIKIVAVSSVAPRSSNRNLSPSIVNPASARAPVFSSSSSPPSLRDRLAIRKLGREEEP